MTTGIKTLQKTSSEVFNRMKHRECVRWYVLVLPITQSTKGVSASVRLLQSELERRSRYGEPQFEYFAPTFVSPKTIHGKTVKRESPLLYNYVFIHASENEIFRLKRVLPSFNLLPRVFMSNGDYYYPYLTDEELENLKWIAASYSNELTLFHTEGVPLVKGDKVRITAGELKGLEAEVVTLPRSRQRQVVVRILDHVLVSLYTVKPGEYEVISLCQQGKHHYAHLGNDAYFEGLHQALGRFYTPAGITPEDSDLAARVIHHCAQLQLDSDILRSKAYSLLLPAYKILSRDVDFLRLASIVRDILPLIKAEQSRALLLVTLYGCTNDRRFYEQSHQMLDPWLAEVNLKKSKRSLLSRLADYDRWFGHKAYESDDRK